jgi:hypothetical protein
MLVGVLRHACLFCILVFKNICAMVYLINDDNINTLHTHTVFKAVWF